MQLILVVEDDPTINRAVSNRFRSEGFDVESCFDGPSAVEAANKLAPDLVVLDLNLPGFDGLEVCRRIHTHRRIPVIMLTARDDEPDMLVGLGVGADDYITKPFSSRELMARTKAVLRRAEAAVEGEPFVHGDITIEPATRRVLENGQELHLTPTEFDLLRALCESSGGVRSREQLLATVWGYRDGSGTRTVDSHIRSLRSKFSTNPIRTVHGVGYALAATPSTEEGIKG